MGIQHRRGRWAGAPAVIGIGITLGLLAMTAQAKVIRVDAGLGPAVGDGIGWGTAYSSLQTALDNAANGDEIWVAEGTYVPSEPDSRLATFQLKSGVALYGGYPAGGGARDPGLYDSVLSGDRDGDDTGDAVDPSHAQNSLHVVTAGTGADATAILDGFVVSGGRANAGDHIFGGGLYNDGGSPTITDCRFVRNSAINTSGSGGRGGGIYSRSGNISITGCAFTENIASQGGGLFTTLSSPRVEDCTFAVNTAIGNGGGYYAKGSGVPLLLGCRFEWNGASNGGGYYSHESNVQAINCEFIQNTASTDGGGVRVLGDGRLTNCVFSGNTARYGGGFQGEGTGATRLLTNCSFSGNSATDPDSAGGGAVSAGGGTHLINCIAWGDTPNEISGSPTVSNSNVQGGFGPEGANANISSDPLYADSANHDLRLPTGSPSIDAGDDNAVPPDTYDLNDNWNITEKIPYDLDGNQRIVDAVGNGDPDRNVDQGAYEQQFVNAPPVAKIVIEQLTFVGTEALVRLDGSDSCDPETPNNDDLVFRWFVDGVNVCPAQPASCETIEVELPYGDGIYLVELFVTDPAGATDADDIELTLDAAALSVFEFKKVKVEFQTDPQRAKIEGEIGLPLGLHHGEVDPLAMIGLMVAGTDVLAVPLVPLMFEVNGGHDEKWKFHDHDAVLGIHKLDIDWKGARFDYKSPDEKKVELKSRMIASTETTLTFKYKMNEIGGAFSLDIGGLATIDVDADGNVTATVPFEVEKAGKEVDLTLPFPIVETTVISFTGAVEETILSGDFLKSSIGRYKLDARFADVSFPGGVNTEPRTVDMVLFIGTPGYSAAGSVGPAELLIKGDDKWEAKQ